MKKLELYLGCFSFVALATAMPMLALDPVEAGATASKPEAVAYVGCGDTGASIPDCKSAPLG